MTDTGGAPESESLEALVGKYVEIPRPGGEVQRGLVTEVRHQIENVDGVCDLIVLDGYYGRFFTDSSVIEVKADMDQLADRCTQILDSAGFPKASNGVDGYVVRTVEGVVRIGRTQSDKRSVVQLCCIDQKGTWKKAIKGYRDAILESGLPVVSGSLRDQFSVCALPQDCDHDGHDHRPTLADPGESPNTRNGRSPR